MSVQNTIKHIENMKTELEEVTGTKPNPNFDPNKPEGPGNKRELVGEFSCEKLQELISTHVKQITDIITSKVESMSELMSTWAPILNVPSNPLKIIKWALKVAFGPAAAAVEAAIKQIQEMVQLISAVAGLAAAVASAAAKLVACLESSIQGAIDDIINSVLEGAADLLAQAEGIVDGIMADILEESGIQDALDTIDGLDAAVTDTVTDLTNIGQVAIKTRADIQGIRPKPPVINIPGGIA